MRKLVVASRNEGKVREITAILADLPVQVVSISEYPDFPDTQETGVSFAENAVLKARVAAQYTDEIVLADDSGLVVDALGGQPGIYSNRFAGDDASDEERYQKVLDLMQDIPDDKRTARFVCAAAVAYRHDATVVHGTFDGVIARSPKGTQGFGYDPIFFIPVLGRTMAELTPEEKNRYSHRAYALEKAKDAVRIMMTK